MAVSKRLRFEIFRRDNHTCQYCNLSGDGVVLEIDHVIPKALGGTDDPTNLLTACKDCNRGKASIPADAPTVAAVQSSAKKWSATKAAATQQLADELNQRQADLKSFENSYYRSLPCDWENTVNSILDAGLPINLVIAMGKVAADKRDCDDRWRYFAGCCWNRVKKLQESLQDTPPGAPLESEEIPIEAEGNEYRHPNATEVETCHWDGNPSESWLAEPLHRSEIVGMHWKEAAEAWMNKTGLQLFGCCCLMLDNKHCGNEACILMLASRALGATMGVDGLIENIVFHYRMKDPEYSENFIAEVMEIAEQMRQEREGA